MSDLSQQTPNTPLTPAELAKVQSLQAQQAVEQGAPLIPVPKKPKPTLPVDPNAVPAAMAQPLTGAININPVNPAIANQTQQEAEIALAKPMPAAPPNIAKTVTPANQQWHDPAQPPLAQTIASAGGAGSAPAIVGSQNKTDPVKEATSQPGFWQQVMDVAGKTGKTLFELLGDFASGYAGKETPTQQRLQREQQLRLQGNEIQAQKDLQSANQGFNAQQQKLQIEHDTAMQAARNDLEKQQIENSYQLRKIEIENQRQMFQLNYRWNILAQTGRTGGVEGLFGGEGK